MINTKDDIWVEGFDDKNQINGFIIFSELLDYGEKIIYEGKTSDIPEEIAKECIDKNFFGNLSVYWDYLKGCASWEKSIQSALTKPDGTVYEFCIIFKK